MKRYVDLQTKMFPHNLIEFSVYIEEVIITHSEIIVITLGIIKDRITEILIGTRSWKSGKF